MKLPFHYLSLQTGLCFTAADNPNHTSKWDEVDKMLEYMETDTILYREVSSITENLFVLVIMRIGYSLLGYISFL